MTKNEFLLNVAIRAMGWGEGADFEMSELIGYDSELTEQMEKHYNVIMPNDERGWDDNHFNSLGAQGKQLYKEEFEKKKRAESKVWDDALSKVQDDAQTLLCKLKKPFECPIYAKKKMDEQIAHMEKSADNPQFYLRGKLEAIVKYRNDYNASLKDAFDYVTEHGWTKEGEYKS